MDISKNENKTLKSLGIPTELRKNGTQAIFALPCPKLLDTQCSIYNDRPKICRDYHCRLHKAVKDGSLDKDQALSYVKEIKRLKSEMADYIQKYDLKIETTCKDPLALLSLWSEESPKRAVNFYDALVRLAKNLQAKRTTEFLSEEDLTFIDNSLKINDIIHKHMSKSNTLKAYQTLSNKENTQEN
ncbi:YkgJ family cysteine cluster protein [Temperatibacter marinus]|uniref:YkgJ family cysteine cluster protein n=1 Tax=Temperatibacter marinus TaxID=1456591 RepID=UPI0035C6F57A